MIKRLFDLLGAAAALVVLAPLLVAVALWIRVDSPGPVLFRQVRVGRGGRLFRIHKFRTMVVDAPTLGAAVTVGDDPRITAAGRWLRHYRIDELPQFIDVILGDMSLVGPRPEVPKYVALYPEALRREVLAVRPGLTDPAALEHIDEAEWLAAAADPEREYVERVLPAKLQRQAAYARQATLGSDMAVLWQTLRVLLSR